MCGHVWLSNRITNLIEFVIVSYRFVITLTATTIIQFLKSHSAIRTVNPTMSTAAPQFFTGAHDFTMHNPVISNYQLGGE
jgi:hypothetical protein